MWFLELVKTTNQWIFRINYCLTSNPRVDRVLAGEGPGLIFPVVLVMVHYCAPDWDDGEIKQSSTNFTNGQHPGHSFTLNPPLASVNLETSFQCSSLNISISPPHPPPSLPPSLLTPHIPRQPYSQLVPQIASCQIKAEQNNLKPRAFPSLPSPPYFTGWRCCYYPSADIN